MSVFAFSVSCDDQLASLTRVFDVFSVLGHHPLQVHARREAQDYVLDVECDQIDQNEAERVARRLLGLVSVSSVLHSPKVFCAGRS